MSSELERPPTPSGFDPTRASARRVDPSGWRLSDEHLAGVYAAIEGRRDIRRFRPDPVPDATLERLLAAAHAAPSVGLMQPWHFVVVRSAATRAGMQAIAQKQRFTQAPHLDARAREYLDLKLEGIREAPVSICVCCDRRPGEEILGRHTIPDTDVYSTCLAVQNLWLAARAEGVGIGWVSFYDEDEVRSLLGIPASVVPVAWLCVGYPDERPVRPGLEAAGWGHRDPLEQHVHAERWPDDAAVADHGRDVRKAPENASLCAKPSSGGRDTRKAPDLVELCAFDPPDASPTILPADHAAAVAARDRSDELIKPQGSLGALETLVERWAAATGAPPPVDPRAGILVLAADHGVAVHGTSLYPQRVSAQVAAAAARGESAIGVLAGAHGARLIVADIGLVGPPAPELRNVRVAAGSADITAGPAMTEDAFTAARSAGAALAGELIGAGEIDVLILGEIGIANTTVASAVLAGLTGRPPAEVCGRGAGLDAQGIARKASVVAVALAANPPAAPAPALAANPPGPPDAPRDPLEVLRTLGGLEFAGLLGAIEAAAVARTPVLLDGFAVGVVALVALRTHPAIRDYLFAGHRSAEPAHQIVLTELGLEPLLDQRMRLGEASGAALALPLIGLAARVHNEMATFDDAGVSRAGAGLDR